MVRITGGVREAEIIGAIASLAHSIFKATRPGDPDTLLREFMQQHFPLIRFEASEEPQPSPEPPKTPAPGQRTARRRVTSPAFQDSSGVVPRSKDPRKAGQRRRA